jgi:hypothetical protein
VYDYYQALVERLPQAAVAWLHYGEACFYHKAFKTAENAFAQARELNPTLIPALYWHAKALMQRGALSEARMPIERALNLLQQQMHTKISQPQDHLPEQLLDYYSLLLQDRAIVHYAQDHSALAKDDYEQLQRLLPHSLKFLVRQAQMRDNLGDSQWAYHNLKPFHKQLQKLPQHLPFYIRILVEQGDLQPGYETCLTYLNSATTTLTPAKAYYLFELFRYHCDRDPQKRRQLLDEYGSQMEKQFFQPLFGSVFHQLGKKRKDQVSEAIKTTFEHPHTPENLSQGQSLQTQTKVGLFTPTEQNHQQEQKYQQYKEEHRKKCEKLDKSLKQIKEKHRLQTNKNNPRFQDIYRYLDEQIAKNPTKELIKQKQELLTLQLNINEINQKIATIKKQQQTSSHASKQNKSSQLSYSK